MADKYNKVEPKIPTGILVSLIAAFVVVVILVVIAIPSNAQRIYNEYKLTADLEYFTKDHPYYEINADDIYQYVEDEETFILFVGSSSDSSTQSHVGTFQRYFESTGADEYFEDIYYLSSTDDAEAFTALVENVGGIIETIPQMILFVDGEAVEIYNASSSTTDQLRNTNVRNYFENVVAAMEEE